MNRKTLVIFFAGLILSFVIFLLTYSGGIDYLALGDELTLGKTPFNDYNKSYSEYFYTYLKNNENLKSYTYHFAQNNYHITDLIDDIKNSKEIKIRNKKTNINQEILKADVITIFLGQPEINDILLLKNNKLVYENIDILINDYIELLSLIRKINDCKIFIIGYYNPLNKTDETIENIFTYIDKKFESLEKNKNIYYVQISEGISNKNYYVPNHKNSYPSLEGYNYISNQIICKFEKSC